MFNYKAYFDWIRPRTEMEIYNRFIFAFCSVHTTWKNNLKGYLLLKDNYHTDKDKLLSILKNSSLGLYNNRAKFIHSFTKKFLANPKFYTKRRNETWKEYATRLQKDIDGLGHAKTRFAIEMIYPNSARVVCSDTHIIQLHKQNPNKMTKRLYDRIEYGFLNRARKHKTNPVEFRWRWWDRKQNYSSPRYWSWCLETKEQAKTLDKIYNENYHTHMFH